MSAPKTLAELRMEWASSLSDGWSMDTHCYDTAMVIAYIRALETRLAEYEATDAARKEFTERLQKMGEAKR